MANTMNDGLHISRQYGERVKSVARIVDVVGEYVSLTKRGRNWLGLCPFHDDTHLGSFVVSEAKNICTCFVCDITCTPVDFLVRKGKTYTEAILYLGKKYCVYDASMYGTPYRAPVPWLTAPASPPKPKPKRRYHFARLSKFMKDTDDHCAMRKDGIVISEQLATPHVRNPLFDFVRKQFGDDCMAQRFQQVCQAYRVTTSDGKQYPGTRTWTIYPYIDEAGFLLTAKYMKYGDDGHRAKNDADGKSTYNIDWLHSMEQRAGRLHLNDDTEISYGLFGLHLRDEYPDAEICIVESEKTAIIAQTFCDMSKKLFMATGGKSRLNADTLRPLVSAGRNIVLYPDVDGMEAWNTFATAYGNELAERCMKSRIMVSRHMRTMHDTETDGAHADIADILMRQWKEAKNNSSP